MFKNVYLRNIFNLNFKILENTFSRDFLYNKKCSRLGNISLFEEFLFLLRLNIGKVPQKWGTAHPMKEFVFFVWSQEIKLGIIPYFCHL